MFSLLNLKKLMYYFIFSCISAVLDFIISASLFNLFYVNYIIANTIGIIAGFIFHFIVSSKTVFRTKMDFTSFAIYLGTFFIGLVLADGAMVISFSTLKLGFYISKFVSMAVPFFITYFLRTVAYRSIEVFRYGEQ